MKTCYIVGGPNGAGKTTFARTFLPDETECPHFVNADLIAAGISPLDPTVAAIPAARMVLERLEELAGQDVSFAFETTFSGRGYLGRIARWKKSGYRIVMFYLRLPSVELAIERVKNRVLEGGHDVAAGDIRRRYKRGWDNFHHSYRGLADKWILIDNGGEEPIVIEESP